MKAIISLLLVAVFLLPSKAVTLKDFLDNTTVELENSASVDTQKRGYWVGGGIRVNTPRVVINPVRITLPHIKVGCTGIDIALGAFDFMNNLDDLLNFLENTVTSAVATMVGGLSAVCPICAQIVTKLNTIANQLNQMQFDSCKLGYELGKQMGDLTANFFTSTVREKLPNGDFSSFTSATRDLLSGVNNLLDKWSSAMRNAGCDPNNDSCVLSLFKRDGSGNFVYKSLLDKALRKTYLGNDRASLQIIRGLIGDLYIVKGGNEKGFKLKYVPPVYEDKTKEKPLYYIAFGGYGTRCEKDTDVKVLGLNDTQNEVEVTYGKPFCKNVEENMEDIVNHLQTRTALTSSQLNFLSQFSIPVYKLLNTISIEPYLLDSLVPKMNAVLVADIFYKAIAKIMADINRAVAYFSTDRNQEIVKKEDLKELQENANLAAQIAYDIYVEATEEWRNTISDMEYYQEIENRIYVRMIQNPIMGAYVFSKGLTY